MNSCFSQWYQTKRWSLLKIDCLILKILWQMSRSIRLVLIQLQPNNQSLRLSRHMDDSAKWLKYCQ